MMTRPITFIAVQDRLFRFYLQSIEITLRKGPHKNAEHTTGQDRGSQNKTLHSRSEVFKQSTMETKCVCS